MKCSLCPRRCNAERDNNKNLNGVCKMPLKPVLSRAALHMWEEPCISGKKRLGNGVFQRLFTAMRVLPEFQREPW